MAFPFFKKRSLFLPEQRNLAAEFVHSLAEEMGLILGREDMLLASQRRNKQK